ncbi:MAG: O-antigen ligase family protein [Vicinamibacterales bacterium]
MWVRESLRRGAFAALLLLTLVYPVRSFIELGALPVWIKALWGVALLLACAAPRASLLLFLAGAPLLASVPLLYHWPPVPLASAWLWALLVAAWGRAVWRPGEPRMPFAAGALLLVATASLIATLYPVHLARDGMTDLLMEVQRYLRQDLVIATSQRPVLSPLRAWLTMAEGLGLVWLVQRTMTGRWSDERWFATSLAVAAGGSVVGAWAVQQWWTGDHLLEFWVEQDPYITRVNASFTDVNALGAYLASIAAIVAVVAVSRRALWWRTTGFVLLSAVLLGIVFTASRIAWLATAFGLGSLFVAAVLWRLGTWSESRQRQLRQSIGIAGIALIVALGSVLAWAASRDVRLMEQRSYVDIVLFTFNMRAPLSERLKGRDDLWRAATAMMVDRPLTGIGLGQYYKDLAAWVPNPDALARAQENAHNYFLQLGAELGWPGLLCLLWLLVQSVLYAARVMRGDASAESKRAALAMAIGVMAFCLTCLTGHSLLLPEGQLTFWALAAVPLAAGAGEPAVRGWSTRIRPWATAAVVLVLALTMPARWRAEVARVDWLRLTMGFHEEERTSAGETFRWTTSRAIFHVPSDARAVTFQVRSVAPFPQTLRVKYAGHVVQELLLSDQQWRPLRYVLPRMSSREPFRRFELMVDPIWEPADDARELGVMVAAISSD